MDLPADESRPVVTPADADSLAAGRIACEQAVYTCLCNAAGQGYRIIAASSGLSSRDCGEIARYTPAMGGLCADTPEATGVSFFPISDMRFAVLYTCHAGKEPTGRGGRRTYTRIFVVRAADLRRFRNNPFALLRAAHAEGATTVDLTADVKLPQLFLSPERGLPTPAFEFAGRAVPQRWIAAATDRLLSGDAVAFSAGVEGAALAELLLLTIPAPIRPEISFSVGVNFTVSRPHRLVVLANVVAGTRERIAGTEYVLLDAAADPGSAPPVNHKWARAVGRFIETRRTKALISMLADRFGEKDVKALERIGELCLALDNAASNSLDNLIDIAMPYVGLSADLPLERELARQVVRLVRHRFSSLISHADDGQLSNVWKRMLGSEPRTPEAARLVEESAALAVTRMSCLDPVRAMRMVLEHEQTVAMERSATDLEYARRTVTACMATWIAQAMEEQLTDAAGVLESWCLRHPEDAAATQNLEQLRLRMTETAQSADSDASAAVEVVAE
ncbi:MAG: GAP1-N2 domain-containing protein [Phycisphaerae bacterium]